MSRSLEVEAARYRIGVSTGRGLVQAAVDAMVAGADSPTLVQLASEPDPQMSDVGPMFERSLEELCLEMPTSEDAAWILLRHLIGRIADGEVDPIPGVGEVLEQVYHPCDLHSHTIDYIGDSHGLARMLGNYYAIDDVRERPSEVSCDGKFGDEAIGALGEHIRQCADEWLSEHGT